jgi:hypothetical protein
MTSRIAMMATSAVLATAFAATPGAPAAPADTGPASTPQTLATTTSNGPIAALHGWVVWSAPASDGWRLVSWHAGVTAELPIASRPEPFDVDLGTDAHNHVVATFSRCRRAPVSDYFHYLDAATGKDCRIRVLGLTDGKESSVRVPQPRHTSDTTPSMWRGKIAFARRDFARHKEVQQILLWSPAKRRLRVLPHGGVPTRCPYRTGCRGARYVGQAAGLDLSAQVVTFLWLIDAPGVFGHLGYEVRADRLTDGHAVLVGAGYEGEACTEGGRCAGPVPACRRQRPRLVRAPRADLLRRQVHRGAVQHAHRQRRDGPRSRR